MIEIEGVDHQYGNRRVLEIGNWQAAQGEQWLVLGPSGSGKTTLLHILAGILRPSSGRVCIAGQVLARLRAGELDRFRGRHVGIVLQKLHLIGSLTVIDNLLLAQYMAGLPQRQVRALELLNRLGMSDKANCFPRELSHGQAQRVALARAVINAPGVLLADEPTSNLDDARCGEACELLVSVAQSCNATLIVATHDQRIRERFPHRFSLEARP